MPHKLSKHAVTRAQQRGVSTKVIELVIEYGHTIRTKARRGRGVEYGKNRLVSCSARAERLMQCDGVGAQLREKVLRTQMIQAGDGSVITVLSPGHRVTQRQLSL